MFGDELSDYRPNQYSRKTWPALWCLENNFEYDCCAVNGASNTTIVRKVIERVENQGSPDLVIVQWTIPTRIEFRYEKFFNSEWGHFNVFHPWVNATSADELLKVSSGQNRDPNSAELIAWKEGWKKSSLGLKQTILPKLAEIYFKYISCSESDRYYHYKNIIDLKHYLESKNIKYVFTAVYSDFIIQDFVSNDKFVNTFMKIAKSCNWVWFNNNMGFLDWANRSNQTWGITHPLDSAHANALDVIRPVLNNILQ